MNGYRLLVPAIWLWFHADDAAWGAVEQALGGAGLQPKRNDGVSSLEGRGFAIEYREENHRLSVELTHEAGPEAVAALVAMEGAAGEPDLETGNCWLWSPIPFALRGAPAEQARRLVRAARWLLPHDRLAVALAAMAAEAAMIPPGVSLTLHLATVVRLEIHVPERQAPSCAPVFDNLIAALGEPDHLAHVTVAA
ncbi:MAG TPA: hypothetical protein VNM16_00125 [Bacillota bacterium]|nr:hypothetical protein [Bacillota bacterium]